VVGVELGSAKPGAKSEGLNLVFGLYPSGYLAENSVSNLRIDTIQLLSPYTAGAYGTLGLNQLD
jgi:hypothetical protein